MFVVTCVIIRKGLPVRIDSARGKLYSACESVECVESVYESVECRVSPCNRSTDTAKDKLGAGQTDLMFLIFTYLTPEHCSAT